MKNKTTLKQAKITGGFWGERLQMNATEAIFYQWQQLENTRCIDNFRMAAGLQEGFREGFFFSDSDAYKWLDAASRILAHGPAPRLKSLVDDFIEILAKAQMPDGYLFTYNQIHFPGERWVSLQIEHEFYCIGHLIEAGVSHHQATGETRLLDIGIRAADLLVQTFREASPLFTDGHEEIEIALMRLYGETAHPDYLELARKFIERRGRIPFYGLRFLIQSFHTANRMRVVQKRRRAYRLEHPDQMGFSLPKHNQHLIPRFTWLRLLFNLLSGKYSQQHAPIHDQNAPVGHAVRFAYLQTAAAMLAGYDADEPLLNRLSATWEQMVAKRMYVTGGIGSLPLTEGFGRDYELNPEVAYAETCAALGSMFWSREMSLITHHPRYDDLFEWTLYNAASVGIGMDGKSYFYNNPLTCRTGLQRAGWYDIPCCPSNLARTWASLGGSVIALDGNRLFINQYISSEIVIDEKTGDRLIIQSGLPWSGEVSIRFHLGKPLARDVVMRMPAWSDSCSVLVNGEIVQADEIRPSNTPPKAANGLQLEKAYQLCLSREFANADTITLNFSMPIRLLCQDRRLPVCGGMAAVARGPLVYCLESVDNAADLFKIRVKRETLRTESDQSIFSATPLIRGESAQGERLTWIPYMWWGNRGRSSMTIFSQIQP